MYIFFLLCFEVSQIVGFNIASNSQKEKFLYST